MTAFFNLGNLINPENPDSDKKVGEMLDCHAARTSRLAMTMYRFARDSSLRSE